MVSSIVLVVFPLIIAIGLVRKIREYQWGRCNSKTPLDGKVFLVTGSNSGVGKETARELAKRNAQVIMACRDLNSAQLAISDIRKSTSSGELVKSKKRNSDDLHKNVTDFFLFFRFLCI